MPAGKGRAACAGFSADTGMVLFLEQRFTDSLDGYIAAVTVKKSAMAAAQVGGTDDVSPGCTLLPAQPPDASC